MSPSIMVPKSRAQNPVGDGSAEFPEGDWIVSLEEVREGDLPPWAGDPVNNGYTSGDGETLSLQFGGARNSDDPNETTNLKHFVEIVTRDGTTEISAGPQIPDSSWKMQNDAALLMNLALAFGETEEVEVDGEEYVQVADDFLERLGNGAFRGREVGVSTFHRGFTRKDGSKGTEVRTRGFFQVI